MLLISSGSVNALEITFIKSAIVDASEIKLADIVSFDEESELSQALATITVGQAPPAGESYFLRSINIKNYLVSQHHLSDEVFWQGSPVVTVSRRATQIGPDKILALIDEFLLQQRDVLPAADIRFIPRALPLPFKIPAGEFNCEVIPSNPAILGSNRFSLIFRNGNHVLKNMSVRGTLEAISNAVVAAKPIKRGTILSRQHLKKARVDIARTPDSATDYSEFIGLKLKKNMRAGSPLTLQQVEVLPVVHRGEKVKIVINSGSMLLTATGLAHSDGKKDQIIRVQNIHSRKVLFCRVTAPGMVEVMM